MQRLLAICSFGALACRPVAGDLSNLACDAGRCAAGYQCDAQLNICIGDGDQCDVEGRELACSADTFRTCRGGAWSPCEALPLGTECVPSSVTCNGNLLVTCTVRGFIDTSRDCGAYGCNNLASPIRCNDCVPNTTRCNVLVFEACGSEGLVTNQQDCFTGSACQGAGACDDTTGCYFLGQAADDTPCDEGGIANGDWCDSSCQSGACVATPPSCDDGNDCTVDGCATLTGCTRSDELPGTPCPGGNASWCDSTCDGAGACDNGAPVNCEEGNPCTIDPCDISTGACSHLPGNFNSPCRAAVDLCDAEERCDGVSTNCPNDGFLDGSSTCRTATDVCDVAESCPGNSPACPSDGFATGSVCRPLADAECDVVESCNGSGAGCPSDQFAGTSTPCGDTTTNTDCTDPDTCNGNGACAAHDAAPGTSCNDCPAGAGRCDPAGCENGGLCPDRCDGSALSQTCNGPGNCNTCRECWQPSCTGGSPPSGTEHQACADTADVTNWGAGKPCVSVSCSGDTSTLGEAVGSDCFAANGVSTPVTVSITYQFTTASPSGTQFNLWMRNAVDANWDANEQYNCSLSGVNGGTTFNFSFVEGDVNTRHGPGCNPIGNTSKYCWLAVDGDTTTNNSYQSVLLDQGAHTLTCSFPDAGSGSGTEDMGYDGIIFTTNLAFVPAENDGPTACANSDTTFTAGTCTDSGNNWGPNVAPSPGSPGRCNAASALANGSPCTAGICCNGNCTSGPCP